MSNHGTAKRPTYNRHFRNTTIAQITGGCLRIFDRGRQLTRISVADEYRRDTVMEVSFSHPGINSIDGLYKSTIHARHKYNSCLRPRKSPGPGHCGIG